MENLVQELAISCVVSGFIYVLIASGLTVIFSLMRILNFAHGDLYMLGTYGLFFLFDQLGLNFALALLVSALAMAVLGIILERVVFRPVSKVELNAMLVSLALSLVIGNFAVVMFKDTERNVSSPFPGSVQILGISLSSLKLATIVAGLILMLALLFLIYRTKVGRAMRSVAMDRDTAAIYGVNVTTITVIGFALSAALASLAGGLIAPFITINPILGGDASLKAFVIVVLGGLGSLTGAIVGGFVMGIIDTIGAYLIGSWVSPVAFLILIVILVIKPQGLFGHEQRAG